MLDFWDKNIYTQKIKKRIIREKIRRIVACIALFCILFNSVYVGNSSIVYAEGFDNIKGELNVSLNIPTDKMRQYIQMFEKKYPNVTINYTCYNSYDIEMGVKMDQGYYADVCFVPGFVTVEEAQDYYIPLDTYQRLSEKYNFMNQGLNLDNVVYSIPCTAYIMGIAYNKDVFLQAGVTEVPKSIDDFMAALSQIKERTDAVPMASGYGLDWIYFNWTTFPYLEMKGDTTYKSRFVHESDPFTPGGTFYQVYKMLYDAISLGYTEENPGSMQWYPIIRNINSGKLGCCVVGSWAINQIKTCGAGGDSIAFMPFPNEVDGTQYAAIMTDYSYAIPLDSKNPKAARAFIDFMIDESGYAINNDRVSIVKSDPLPQSYGNLSDVIFSLDGDYQDEDFWYYSQLTKGVNPVSNDSLIRIVEAAYRMEDETFEGIMAEWNTRWEDNRPVECETYRRGTAATNEKEVVDSSENMNTTQYQTNFSATEKQYLKNVGTIKVGYVDDMAPFSYEKNGVFDGISKELCDELKNQIGINIEYRRFSDTDACVLALKNGEIDIAASIPTFSKYTSTLKTSIPYFNVQTVLMHHDADTMLQFTDKKQIVLHGDENPDHKYANSEKTEAFSMAELVNAIDSKKADFAVTNFYSAEYYTKAEAVEHVEIFPIGNKVDIVMAFSRNADTRLISICNKVLYGIEENQVQEALMRHMNPPVKPITWKRILEAYTLEINLVILGIMSVLFLVLLLYNYERYKRKKNQMMDAQKYEILSKLMEEYIFEYRVKDKKLILDQKFDDKFGYGKEIQKMLGATYRKSVMMLFQLCDEASNRENFTTDPFKLTDKEGKQAWYKMVSYRVDDSKKEDYLLYGKIMDIDEEVIEKMKMRSEAEQDALTGVYNRLGFEKKYMEMVADMAEEDSVCISVFDMDDFKSINDSMGHLGGDEALKHLANQLKSLCDERMIASRYGGDEFILAFFGVSVDEVEEKLSKIVERMDNSFHYDSFTHYMSISVGAYYTNDKSDYRKVFNQADDVLYHVKENGKNNYSIRCEQP